jgi:hypothetical protein
VWAVSVPPARPPAPSKSSKVIQEPVQPKEAPATPVAAPITDAELISMHREAQRALSLGLSTYAMTTQIELERIVCREWDLDPLDDDGGGGAELLCSPIRSAKRH